MLWLWVEVLQNRSFRSRSPSQSLGLETQLKQTFIRNTKILQQKINTRHRASTSTYSLTSRVRRYAVNACHVHRLPIRAALCCHSNETRAPIANPPNSAQLGVPPTIPKVTSRSVQKCGHAASDRYTDRQMSVTTVHSTTHVKCTNN